MFLQLHLFSCYRFLSPFSFLQKGLLFASTMIDNESSNIRDTGDKPKEANARMYSLSGLQGEEWRKWSGNCQPSALIERQLRTLAPNIKGPKLIIPFKPAIWKKLEREEKLVIEAAATAAPAAVPTQMTSTSYNPNANKRAHGHTQNTNNDFYESFEEFIRNSPFLSHLSTDQILTLENSMIQENFQDGQVIATEGQPVAVTLLRMGQVVVTHAKSVGSLQEVECATLKRYLLLFYSLCISF